MSDTKVSTTKKNVSQFEEDVRNTGSYAYTAEVLSSRYANARISKSIHEAYNFSGKKVLDLGCGDGTYTVEFISLGVKEIIGVDPASAAVDAAKEKAAKLGIENKAKFETGNIYELDELLQQHDFDCIVIRGVLHHLPDPAKAIAGLSNFSGAIVILEPNGNNPVLKLLEQFSKYHIDHEERSFFPSLIRSWLVDANFKVRSTKFLNLVPMFCPDWMANLLERCTPIAEKLPALRNFACGQIVIVAEK